MYKQLDYHFPQPSLQKSWKNILYSLIETLIHVQGEDNRTKHYVSSFYLAFLMLLGLISFHLTLCNISVQQSLTRGYLFLPGEWSPWIYENLLVRRKLLYPMLRSKAKMYVLHSMCMANNTRGSCSKCHCIKYDPGNRMADITCPAQIVIY